MGGIKKFNTGAFQHGLLPGDGRDLDLVTLRAANGGGDSVGTKATNPELSFPTYVDQAGRVLTEAVAMLENAFPGAEVVEDGAML